MKIDKTEEKIYIVKLVYNEHGYITDILKYFCVCGKVVDKSFINITDKTNYDIPNLRIWRAECMSERRKIRI